MYRGMLEIASGDPGTGVLTLVDALSTALAIGAGVILGGEILRALTLGDLARRALRPTRTRQGNGPCRFSCGQLCRCDRARRSSSAGSASPFSAKPPSSGVHESL